MSTTMLVAVIILVGVGAYAGVFLFQKLRKPNEDATRYFRCPSCHSKIRYLARQAGHQAMCASCRQRFTFPSLR